MDTVPSSRTHLLGVDGCLGADVGSAVVSRGAEVTLSAFHLITSAMLFLQQLEKSPLRVFSAQTLDLLFCSLMWN